MSQELMWLTLTVLMTALFWVPYVLNRIAVRGLMGAMANPPADAPPGAAWAERASAAHKNAIENLVVFAALVLTVHVTGLESGFTATACLVYFLARAGHFVVYTAGIPVLRTLVFAVAFFAQLALALRLLGIV